MSGEHNQRTKLQNRLNAVLHRHDSSATKTWFRHGKGIERCERWFWIRSIWVGRGRGVERGKKWFSGRGEGVWMKKDLLKGGLKGNGWKWVGSRRGEGTRHPPYSCMLWSAVRYSPTHLVSADLNCLVFLGVVYFSHLSLTFTLTSFSVLCSRSTADSTLISPCLRSVHSHCDSLHK